MPFWRQESAAAKQRREIQVASRKALAAGGIPLEAQHRLEAQRLGGDSFFSSDLSCKEYLLSREAGYEPIGLVMGTAFYKVSFWGYFRNYQSFTGELSALTQAQLTARRLAVNRMQQEAEILGATGVVGVRLQTKGYDWSSRTVEFTSVGTAIRVPNRASERAFTSGLSGQEFWQLQQAGYWPKGLVFGICSYYVHTNWDTQAMTRGGFFGRGSSVNQEVTQYTQGFQQARHLAISRLTENIGELGAEGAVGMDIDADVEDIEYEINDTKYHDLLAHFMTTGTAIVHDRQIASNSARSPLMFYNLAGK